MEKRQDLLTGLIFTGLGLAAAWMARSYSGAGGTYPMVLGLALAIFGGVIALRSVRAKVNAVRPLSEAPRNLFLATVVATGYIALVMPLGFFTASVLLMLVMPVVLGFRQPVYLVLMALVFMALVWVVFSAVLEKPLPPEFWSTLWREA
ncbi:MULTISPECIES: tripartite tricarboxylate transporter TctB family protein [unclassified Roseovarius]|jgi:putative tricarboxylic transport membrane protein|uniref:tripartite tricarboxylate transporter TctB family protein n=1 Tax=unclassified Roseovarius TaxID=2614913 RepID=UPI0000685D3E|nr:MULTISPECIES: tripartite tricarboxylate transporter TctB family protein [unclassified Roseovarius]EAQ26105.1 hypothetical protein ROS217_13051 [Roseovarius sp. 217]KJS41462.1 MAG: hypothetical protein VR71_19100 [Roseovarius sp. BRH_c41]